MIKIRLKRYGRKHKPSYRIIAIDSRSKREGKALEELGFYDPLKKKVNFKSFSSIISRLRQGAQITNTVYSLLNQEVRATCRQLFRYRDNFAINEEKERHYHLNYSLFYESMNGFRWMDSYWHHSINHTSVRRRTYRLYNGVRYIPSLDQYFFINNRSKFPTFEQQLFSINKRRNKHLFLRQMVRMNFKKQYGVSQNTQK